MPRRYPTARWARGVVIAGLAVVQGCGAAVRSEKIGAPLAPAASYGDGQGSGTPTRITSVELRQVQGWSAMDAVQRLRPEFLRGTQRQPGVAPVPPTVYESGRYLGSTDELRDIPLRIVKEIRWLSPVEARVLFGSTCPCDGGVIGVWRQQ